MFRLFLHVRHYWLFFRHERRLEYATSALFVIWLHLSLVKLIFYLGLSKFILLLLRSLLSSIWSSQTRLFLIRKERCVEEGFCLIVTVDRCLLLGSVLIRYLRRGWANNVCKVCFSRSTAMRIFSCRFWWLLSWRPKDVTKFIDICIKSSGLRCWLWLWRFNPC